MTTHPRSRASRRGTCSRASECKRQGKPPCFGCGFQHFDEWFTEKGKPRQIRGIWRDYFRLIQRKRGTAGGRIPLDKPINSWFSKRRGWREMKGNELRDKVVIRGRSIPYDVKCDGAYQVGRRYVFLEVKGYGFDSNSILSAITAAQMVSFGQKFGNGRSSYFYLGGLASRARFHGEGKACAYVKWAETQGFIHFYGIGQVNGVIRALARESQR